MRKSIGNISDRIHEDRTKQYRKASFSITPDTPGNASDEHPAHLHIKKKDTGIRQFFPAQAQVFQTGHPDNAEQQEIVNINEVTQCSYKNGCDQF